MRTRGFAGDRDLVGIAAESGNVALDPFERGDKVEKAVGARRAMVRFGGEFGMGEEAQRIEPMVKRDDDDASCRKTRAVVARFGARADDRSAAVDPYHCRQARAYPRSSRRPNIEIEAILGDAGGVRIDIVPDDALQRIGAEGMGRADARPGRNRLRRVPTQRSDRRGGVGNALVNANAACVRLWNCERAALDRQTLRRQARPPDAASTDFAACRRIGISSRPAKRALEPSASSMRNASFHFAIRSERANEPTFSWPAPQPIAR